MKFNNYIRISVLAFSLSVAACANGGGSTDTDVSNNSNNSDKIDIILNNANNTDKVPFGSPCDETTNCEGICNIGLPDGMCIIPCSDTEPCEQGECIEFAENASYCVPSCNSNGECRDKYTCINNVCRPFTEIDDSCNENSNCLPCEEQTECSDGKTAVCVENICSFTCKDNYECPDYMVCSSSNQTNYCLPLGFETGIGTYGDSCAAGTCAAGFTCLTNGTEDVFASCSKECSENRNCPPDMICKDVGSGTKWCVTRNMCDHCTADTQCRYQTDKCVSADPSVNSAQTYCSVKCDPDLSGTCPGGYTCHEAFFCADKNAWVQDCSWCPTGDCNPQSPPLYQCFINSGSCG